MPVSRGTVMVTWTRAGADGEKCTGDYLFEIADGLNVQGKRCFKGDSQFVEVGAM